MFSNASTIIESVSVIQGAKWSADLITDSDLHFHLRPACPDDEADLADFFAGVSAEDLRFRFLTAVRRVNHEVLVDMTDIDHE